MYFKIGFTVRPKLINDLSQVVFEKYNSLDKLVEVSPTSDECTAYGFVYRSRDNRCVIVENNLRFNYPKPTDNLSINSSRNTIGRNTRDNIIAGGSHILFSNNFSNIISGENNSVKDLVSNTTVSGTRAEATTDNSNIIGGNKTTDILAERQSITLMYGTKTTNSTTVDSYLNNTVGSYFTIPDNSIVTFETNTVAVRVGGSGGGSVGDFKAFTEVGAAINKSGVLSIDSSRTKVADVGSTAGWVSTVGVRGTSFLQQVKGANNRDVKWATTIRFTEIRTGIAL